MEADRGWSTCKHCQRKFRSSVDLGRHAWKVHRKQLLAKTLAKKQQGAAEAAGKRNMARTLTSSRMHSARAVRGGLPGSKR